MGISFCGRVVPLLLLWALSLSPSFALAGEIDADASRSTGEPCPAHCVVIQDFGTQRLWFYLDGAGKMHLDWIETVAAAKGASRHVEPVVTFLQMRSHDVSADAEKSLGCGTDGWGWYSGRDISTVYYANGTSVVTSYSHAGQAVRTALNANGTIQSTGTVSSGIRSGTPTSCKKMRDEVLGMLEP